MAESGNFAFLEEHDPVFLQLASSAERAFAGDPKPQRLAGMSGNEWGR